MGSINAETIRKFNDNNLYKDNASIYRYENVKNLDGSTIQKLKDMPELSGLPCLLNIEKPDDAALSGEANSVNMVYSMFTSDLLYIKSGDHINIRRYGKDYMFIAGEPIKYDFHQEVPLNLKGWA